VLQVAALDLTIGALVGHLLQRVEQRLLSPVDVFQFVLEEFLDRLHRHAHASCIRYEHFVLIAA
jgi:hypothetical protein